MANKKTAAAVPASEDLRHLPADVRSADAANTKLIAAHRDAIDRIYGNGREFDEARSCGLYRAYRDAGTQMFLLAGAELILIKEHTEHGRFAELLRNELDTEPRAAQRMMQAATKFLTSEGKPRALIDETQVGAGKLIELLILDDDDIEAIERGERVAGIDKDDIANMSVSELRKALKASREEKAADEQLIAKFEERATRHERELAKAKRGGREVEETSYTEALDAIGDALDGQFKLTDKVAIAFATAMEELAALDVPKHMNDIGKRTLVMSSHARLVQFGEIVARLIDRHETEFARFHQDARHELPDTGDGE